MNNLSHLSHDDASDTSPSDTLQSTRSSRSKVHDENKLNRLAGEAGRGLHRRSSAQDASPGLILRKITTLFENRHFEDCENTIKKLTPAALKSIQPLLKVDVFLSAIPESLGILEVIYGRYFLIDPDGFPSKILKPDKLLMKIIHWISGFDDGIVPNNSSYEEDKLPTLRNLVRITSSVSPTTYHKLCARQKILDKCVEGLGRHGLVDTSESKLLNLHDALKIEFSTMINQLRGIVQKLEELSLVQRTPVMRSVVEGPAPTNASHQRLVQLNLPEVQERLIKNKSLLNVVQPAMSNSYLQNLLQILDQRIQIDKEVLFHFTELRKDIPDIPANSNIAPVLQKYSRAFLRVIKIFEETDVNPECNGSVADDVTLNVSSCSSESAGKLSLPIHAVYYIKCS